MQTPISLNTLKLHNERLDKLLVRLEENFGWKPVHPKENINTIMYRAGQASVIEYINSIMEEEILCVHPQAHHHYRHHHL